METVGRLREPMETPYSFSIDVSRETYSGNGAMFHVKHFPVERNWCENFIIFNCYVLTMYVFYVIMFVEHMNLIVLRITPVRVNI